MDSNNVGAQPTVMKESKNKIKVDFERTPLKERLKAKFINTYFIKNVVFKLFRVIFLLGIAYVILYPFITKIAGSFMSREDFVDVTVMLIPKNFTLDTYKAVWTDLGYLEAFKNTLLLSLACAVLQTFACCLIAYGLAKYKFKGNKILFLLVVLTMIIPHRTLEFSLEMAFKNFDILGIISFLSGGVISGLNVFGSGEIAATHSINLLGTVWPMIILSVTGLAFKNGLYIFMLRQFFRGIPDSLEESAYIDGSGDFRTFLQIIIPMSVPMMITVFLFSFCWQWTDLFYTNLFFDPAYYKNPEEEINFLSKLYTGVSAGRIEALDYEYEGRALYEQATRNTCFLMAIAPLVVLYVFLQRYLVEGIERSGLTAE
ncbi:MAG: carbohydrate ABC transporter permease [Ruminococcaceae bacterium]|nr:carbohydrate ABC transporter permease [Oscillospiraceae bacterium]